MTNSATRRLCSEGLAEGCDLGHTSACERRDIFCNICHIYDIMTYRLYYDS